MRPTLEPRRGWTTRMTGSRPVTGLPRDGRGGVDGVLLLMADGMVPENFVRAAHQVTAHGAVRVTGSVAAALADPPQGRRNVVVVDSALDPAGYLIQNLASGRSRCRLIVVVDPGPWAGERAAEALLAGADVVIPRDADPRTVADALRRTTPDRDLVRPELVRLPAGRIRFDRCGRHDLTRRELQVLHLMAEGIDNQEIASLLVVSLETVRSHVKSILRKLDARDRARAVALAYRHGVVSPLNVEVAGTALAPAPLPSWPRPPAAAVRRLPVTGAAIG
ncbi:hypothetical protein GCM10012275_37420 [Longimycelium tulufanense]|uniref:HTH luxR-type domain-containing protein n=1 Tax=Longimycelium tulufanense TaxID=907463 RepID=A0A8J3CG06_9PSEU|nr:response regulator transcription factor [Longimycelium tulufanense]GGM63336.1 hypothetical protein GCM10012275_37420 [Longimycelium tulufanense]